MIGVAALVLLGITSAAFGSRSWLQSAEEPEQGVLAPDAAPDPTTGPIVREQAPVAESVGDYVRTYLESQHELMVVEAEVAAFDMGDGAEVSVAQLEAHDGSLVEVVVQRLRDPIPMDHLRTMGYENSIGPNGEEVISRVDDSIQIIAISAEGLSVSVIVGQGTELEPAFPSVLDALTRTDVEALALILLANHQDWELDR